MKKVPLTGAGLFGKSAVTTRQRLLNVYAEQRPDGDKTGLALYGTPGLTALSNVAYLQPFRALLGLPAFMYAIIGGTLQQIDITGNTINQYGYGPPGFTGTTFCSMAASATQLLIVDPTLGAFVFTPSTGLINPVTPFPPAASNTCTFCAGFFVADNAGTNQFYVSNYLDATSWGVNPVGIDVGYAVQYGDTIVAVDALTSNLIILCAGHTEFWQVVGSAGNPFACVLSATSEYGLAAISSRAHIAGNLCYLALNRQGTVQVVAINGYTTTPISDPDLDNVLNKIGYWSDMTAISYVVDSHPMYQLTSPSASRSFLYDFSTSLWTEVQSGITGAYAQRHRAVLSTAFQGKTIVSVAEIPAPLHYIDPTSYVDGYAFTYPFAANTQLREIVTRHASQDFNVFSIDEVYLDFETGVGLVSGQGSVPTVTIECSKDNGRTWTMPVAAGIGPLGGYLYRAVWRRFGSARDFVFRIRMSDPVKFVVTGGAITVRERKQ